MQRANVVLSAAQPVPRDFYSHDEGLEGMIVDNIKPQVDRFVFPDVHRVIVVASGRLLILSRCGAVSVGEARSHDTATVQVEPAKELIRW